MSIFYSKKVIFFEYFPLMPRGHILFPSAGKVCKRAAATGHLL